MSLLVSWVYSAKPEHKVEDMVLRESRISVWLQQLLLEVSSDWSIL